MNGADAFDVASEVIGPKGRWFIGCLFFGGLLIFHEPTMHLFNWLVMQRAHELTDQFIKALPQA